VTELNDLLARVDALARGDSVVRARLGAAAQLAVRIVPGCSSASVAILLETGVSTAAVSDRLALEVDLLQYRFGEGPCLDVLQGQVVRVDLREDEAYRRFAPGAIDAGIATVLSLPCQAPDGRIIGSLNLYGTESDTLERAEAAAAPFVAYVTEVLLESDVLAVARTFVDEATTWLDEQGLVNRAVGFLAHRRGCTPEAALAVLAAAAADRNVPLVEVARDALDDRLPD
jgi:hypothetical protein